MRWGVGSECREEAAAREREREARKKREREEKEAERARKRRDVAEYRAGKEEQRRLRCLARVRPAALGRRLRRAERVVTAFGPSAAIDDNLRPSRTIFDHCRPYSTIFDHLGPY